MMTCVPGSTECPDGNFHTTYEEYIGTGSECGYVDYPTSGSARFTSGGGGMIGNWVLIVMFVLKLIN